MLRIAVKQVINHYVIRPLFSRIFFPDFHSASTYPVWHRI